MEERMKHLEMIQGVIQRMANNSFLMKGWAVTLIVSVFVLADRNTNQNFFWVAFVPIIFFWFLDSYYLLLERKYIFLYNKVRKKNEKVDFDLSITDITYKKVGNKNIKFIRCFFSLNEMLFYLPLGIIMVLIYSIR